MSGVLRGCGRQVLGACVNIVSFYILALPVGISLALAAKMGTLGMWIGLAIASITQVHLDVVVYSITSLLIYIRL